MGADTTFVLKKFIIWNIRGNNMLLPEIDVIRCTDKVSWAEWT